MRATKTITLTDRGEKREFVITELGVWKLQRVILRIGCELLKTGMLEQETSDAMQMAQNTITAIQNGALSKLGNVNPDAVQDILGDLLPCVEYKVGNVLTKLNQENVETYIVDEGTLWALEQEIFNLHFGFLQGAVKSVFPRLSIQKADNSEDTSKPKMYLRS